MYIKVYTFHSFLALNSTHIICEASNLNTTFVLMLIIILLSFVDWRRGCMRCILYVWGWAFHMYGKVYTFHSFLALNYTHIICEASNLNTTFVLMLIVIFLSFIDWRRGWGVFCTREDELNFHMYGKVYTFHSLIFSSQFYTHHLWSFKLEHYLCFDANSHILEFCWLATWLRCVQCMWGWAFHMYGKVYTFHSFLALNYTHIICEASNLNTTFVLMLIIILLSFVDWRRGCMRCILYVWGWSSFSHVWQSVHVSQVFSSQFYTHLWSFKLEHYLCFDANSHILEFHRLTTWLRCVLYTWGWA